MPPDIDAIHGVAIWPGVATFEGATYTTSHGMTPGVCILRCAEQQALPAEFASLVLTDGNETVVLPDCKLQAIKVDMDDRGRYWILEILDRRWRWKEFGYINGCFNQMTPFGKLIPWTIRSPTELAVLCLTAMGETDYTINLPDGINNPGPNSPNPVINVSGVNPPVDWNGVPPAQALQQLVDRCGCRLVYRWSTDSVWIGPVGSGKKLPAGSIAKRLPSLNAPLTPSGVGVIGAPTRYQCRLALTAVGKEWDGSYWPINLLSYAPLITTSATVQISTVAFANMTTGLSLKLTLTDKAGQPHTIGFASGATDAATVSNAVAAVNAAGADPEWAQVEAAAVGGVCVITALVADTPFNLSASYFADPIPDPEPQMVVETTQAAQPATSRPTWENCYPPEFQGVRATSRLTVADAQRLASESVWRTYQLTGVDVSGKGTPIIPGYEGKRVKRTMQIVLQDTQVDQITPQLPNNQILTLSSPVVNPPDSPNAQDVGIPLTVNFYNGYSQDKPAAVYGSIATSIVNDLVMFLDADGVPLEEINTPAGSQVFVPFSVEPEFFLIRFASPVFAVKEEGFLKIPSLILQTAVLIRDELNNQIVSFTRIRALDGGDPSTPPAMRHFPDVQVNVTSVYDSNNKLKSWAILEKDPIVRAELYLDGLANEYQYKPGQTVEFNGVRALDLDGLTWQITWNVAGECSTVATQNGEHSIWIPPLPARRRAEYLPPVTRLDQGGNRVDMITVTVGGSNRGVPTGGAD